MKAWVSVWGFSLTKLSPFQTPARPQSISRTAEMDVSMLTPDGPGPATSSYEVLFVSFASKAHVAGHEVLPWSTSPVPGHGSYIDAAHLLHYSYNTYLSRCSLAGSGWQCLLHQPAHERVASSPSLKGQPAWHAGFCQAHGDTVWPPLAPSFCMQDLTLVN